MAQQKKSKTSEASAGRSRTPSPVRSTSGAGFEFEDKVGAWLMAKMLAGDEVPGIGGAGIQLQAQVSALGWHIEDLLLTAEDNAKAVRRLAISAKGNLQVNASGLPADFVQRAWRQWRDSETPISRSGDGLALVTLGTHPVFDPTWREVKNACIGSDISLIISRIRSNPKQLRVFESVQRPDKAEAAATDAETIELIRRLHVLPVDFQLPNSEKENESARLCRHIVAGGDATDAGKLWKELLSIASDVRTRRGTIALTDLSANLREKFDLRQHPDFERDWQTLDNITADYKARIETSLSSGYSVPRSSEKNTFGTIISENTVAVLFGNSGSGKSAFVKEILDGQFGTWKQIWFGPEDLKIALSASRRGALPLKHEIGKILTATVNPKNIFVIDAAERIEQAEFGVIRNLLKFIVPQTGQVVDSAWHIIVICQSQSLLGDQDAMLGDLRAKPFQLGPLSRPEVMQALWASPSISWLAAHEDTVAALTNLKTLAWVISAGPALGANPRGLASHTAIADRLWTYWTKDRADIQALTMRLAKREASFERSFALTDLDQTDVVTFSGRPAELPLVLNQRTNRVEFEHDLAADWARFQFLKQILTNIPQWATLAENPLWSNALRMLGQYLLRQPAMTGTKWDEAFENAHASKIPLAADILLDALCLDSDAERLMTLRLDMLLANRAAHLSRMLLRFHHIATVPLGAMTGHSSFVSLFVETRYRSVVVGLWPSMLRFLIKQREKLADLALSAVAKVIHTWLTGTPQTLDDGTRTPFRRELTELALAIARTVQVEKGHGVIYVTRDPLLYTASLAGAADLPHEIGEWALELAGRKEDAVKVKARIAEVLRRKAEEHTKRLKADREYAAKHTAKREILYSIGPMRKKLPPWPLGAKRKIDMDFRDACLADNGLMPLMRALPDIAAEVLLALIIEDQPEQEYGSSRLEIDLGLECARDGYPTAFWKSPFFSFLQIAPNDAFTALIAFVDFCTDRWVSEVMNGGADTSPGLTLRLAEDETKTFAGWHHVFDWVQTNSHRDGNLFCALDALERWFIFQIDAGKDVTKYFTRILNESHSLAFVGLLANVGKYRPSFFAGVLSPLLTNPYVFLWDFNRVQNIDLKFDGFSWSRAGEAVLQVARTWSLAPHRRSELLDVAVDLIKTDEGLATLFQKVIPTWSIPENPKDALECKLISAMLMRENYVLRLDPKTGNEILAYECPPDLNVEALSWNAEQGKPLQYLVLAQQCESLIKANQNLNEDQASQLYDLMRTCESDTAIDEGMRKETTIALAATLITSGAAELLKTPGAMEHVLSVVRAALGEVSSKIEQIRSRRIGSNREELKFAAYAATYLWIKNGDQAIEWERSVVQLLTSGDYGAATVVVSVAYAHRDRLGAAWWRLLQAGMLWSGLVLLSPYPGEDDDGHKWDWWLTKLRRLQLRGRNANGDDLRIERVAAGCERLDFARRMKYFLSGDQAWRGKPERRIGLGLDDHFLAPLFSWLINGIGTGDWDMDLRLVNNLWSYESDRAKGRAKDETGEYDLPSQHLGYDLLLKLAELSLAAPEAEATAIWKSVLVHGTQAHYAIRHFITGLFCRLSKGDDPAAFERIWREIAEYGLIEDWGTSRLWYYGERILCDILGFGNEDSLLKLVPGAVARMKDIYERWAVAHLMRDEDAVMRFCYFLISQFGEPLRLEGLSWIESVLMADKPSSHWHREATGNALIELLSVALNKNAVALISDGQARNALLGIAAKLAARNIPAALGLQERIKKLA